MTIKKTSFPLPEETEEMVFDILRASTTEVEWCGADARIHYKKGPLEIERNVNSTPHGESEDLIIKYFGNLVYMREYVYGGGYSGTEFPPSVYIPSGWEARVRVLHHKLNEKH